MDQHKLYRTIRFLTDEPYRTEEQLLSNVLEHIINNEQIPIKGGRLWKLESSSCTYRLIRQFGETGSIEKNFRLRAVDYPPFLQLSRKGAIVSSEPNKYLRTKGIKLFSATGVGEKVRWRDHDLYQYVIAINGDYMKHDMTYTLNIIGSALTSALRNRKIESKAKLLEQDLDKARDIQKSILPEHEMKFAGYEIYGISLPDRIVGGDFFDYLQSSDDKERLAVVIGDAASKGLSAAAQALYVSGALRMGVEYQTKVSTLMGRVNRLVSKTFTAEHFISMAYIELNSSDKGIIVYINAGHCNPIILRGKSDEVERLPASGQLIGPFPQEKYRTEYATFNKGDVMLLYTDGITDAANENREMYGEQRLIAKLKEQRSNTPKEICRLILEDVQLHNRLIEYSDDKTMVVIKRIR